MSKLDILLLAMKNFTRRMARSILTIVGVVIGSMAIIVMVSLGIGIQESMMKSIERWGDLTTINVYLWNIGNDSSTVYVSSGGGYSVMSAASSPSSRSKNDKNPYFEAIENIEALDHVIAAMPLSNDSVRLVSGKYVSPWFYLYLVDASKLQYFNLKTSQGRMLNENDGDFAMVMNPYAGQEFLNMKARNPYDWSKRPVDEFGNVIPYVDIYNDVIKLTFDDRYGEKPQYGETTRRRAVLYDVDVVGYQEDASNYTWMNMMDRETYVKYKKDYLKNLMRGMSKDEAAMYQAQMDRLDTYEQAYVKVDDRNSVAEVVQQIRDLGYDCYSNMEWVESTNEQMAVIQLIMGAIGAVALLVAAINIANTMIMSIYERTKEIGIMKVIGCRLGDICLLFLLEAAIIGLIGGVIGVAASYGASAVLNNLPPDSINRFFGFYIDPSVGGTLSVVPIWLVLLALSVSVGIAVIAGLYPSIRAMRLSALEAIRNE
ncbi:MAG: ABC transporter permease [Oscillospiraceae bacterium]|nr:ABC transporter permease [Oscillospiraceae bacterium]